MFLALKLQAIFYIVPLYSCDLCSFFSDLNWATFYLLVGSQRKVAKCDYYSHICPIAYQNITIRKQLHEIWYRRILLEFTNKFQNWSNPKIIAVTIYKKKCFFAGISKSNSLNIYQSENFSKKICKAKWTILYPHYTFH